MLRGYLCVKCNLGFVGKMVLAAVANKLPEGVIAGVLGLVF